MRLKIYIVTSLISFLTISCQKCNDNLNNHFKTPKKHKKKEAYKYNQTPLIGHIDILKHNGEDYQILIEQIICDSLPSTIETNQPNIHSKQEEKEFSPYFIKLEPGYYQIKLHDKIHHHTYTRYITIGLKPNID
jgi:hypothetical protein